MGVHKEKVEKSVQEWHAGGPTGLASLAPRSVRDDFAEAVGVGQELAKGLANTLRVLALIQASAPSYPMADKVLDFILPGDQLGEAIINAQALLDAAMTKLEDWQGRVDAEAGPSRLLEWSIHAEVEAGGAAGGKGSKHGKGKRRGKFATSE